MKYYTALTEELLKPYNKIEEIGNGKKGNRNAHYINTTGAFDIEASSIETNNGDKRAFMYLWVFTLSGMENVYYGRTWGEFKELMQLVSKTLRLGKKRRIVVYVHNLAYEFQFMRLHFNWLDVGSTGERKPYSALTDFGVEFRCSYILSGSSLEYTASQLPNSNIEKQTGDLDYLKVRHHLTELSPKELNYAKIDVNIVIEYIESQMEIYGNIVKIPPTNTGRVRKYTQDYVYYNNPEDKKKSSGGIFKRQEKLMNRMYVTSQDYAMLKASFAGGFVHANEKYVGKVLENVSSIDFTSSYPAVMIAEKFPMGPATNIDVATEQEMVKLSQNYALVFHMKITGLRPKITQDYYLSESRCYRVINAEVYNGRIKQADSLITTTTSVDFSVLRRVYDWDKVEFAHVKRYEIGYLPSRLLEVVLDLYKDKTVLKGVAGKETEYLLSKIMLNSLYGMTVTDIVRTDKKYSKMSWQQQAESMEKQVERYNSQKRKFLYYPWGVFVTAYARRNLWTGIIAMGDDYVYSDTDSIKFLNYEKHLTYINNYNEHIQKTLELSARRNQLDINLLSPKTQEGKEKFLGFWDYEGTSDKFKTLGAKQYLTQHNDKLGLTVAGLSKQKGLCYLLEEANGDVEKVFGGFNEEMHIPAEYSGNLTHTYIDFPDTLTVTDYKGVTTEVEVLSGLHLEPTSFSLSIEDTLAKVIGDMQKNIIPL